MAVPAGHGNRQFVDDAQVRAKRDTRHATRDEDEDEDEDEKWMEFALRVRLTDRSRK